MRILLLVLVCSLAATDRLCAVAADKPTRLRVLTYNVLSDHRLKAQRLPHVLALLQQEDADLIALQEVAPWFLHAIEEAGLLKRYHVPRINGQPDHRGGLLLMSKTPIAASTYADLPSAQGRGYALIKTQLAGQQFAIASCHLESFLEDGPTRARQLQIIFQALAASEQALCLGDFNFGDGEQPESKQIPASYQDAWLALRPGQAGYTWNKEKSLMAWRGSFANEDSRRLDRVLMRSSVLRPMQVRIIGDQPVPENHAVFPSDHFGLVVDYGLRDQHTAKDE